jgi:hypothetical protein
MENAAGVEIFLAQRGAAFEAGAFEEMTIEVDEALGVGLCVVGIGVDDLICVGGTGGSTGENAEREDESEADALP